MCAVLIHVYSAHPCVWCSFMRYAPSLVDPTKMIGSEDHCLELDIHVAEGVTDAKSVLVYIHGGAHDFGTLGLRC